MDLLFKRYASPFVLLDGLILTSSSSDFIDDFLSFKSDDELWEYFLHKVFDMSWGEFISHNKLSNEDEKEIDLGATVTKSKNMLKNFTPE